MGPTAWRLSKISCGVGGRLRVLDPNPLESFRGLLLRYRARTGLIQRDLATRAGVSRNSIQDWESGLSYPTAERLQALIRAVLEGGGLTAGREAAEARELWAAVQGEAPRMHAPFDDLWFASVFDTHATAGPTPAVSLSPAPASVSHTLAADNELPPLRHVEDWGEAPDTLNFVGRVDELARLRGWVFQERCRLVAILGMGGIGKTSLPPDWPRTSRLASSASTGAACAMHHP